MAKLDEVSDFKSVQTDEKVIFHYENGEKTEKKLRGYGKVIEKPPSGTKSIFWLPMIEDAEVGLITANQHTRISKNCSWFELEDEVEQ